MRVIPANLLLENCFQEEDPDPVDLALSSVVQARDKNVAHQEVYGTDDGDSSS